MKLGTTRTGAFALAGILFATGFGTAVAGANASDGDANLVAEDVIALEAESAPTQPEVRFVASPVVQELPEEPAEPEAVPVSEVESLGELVATVDTTGAMSREMRCLAQAVYFESRGEPLAGQLAVAKVVINRAESSVFPDDYCSVVTQRAQFSFVKGGRIPAARETSQAWQRAKAIARIAHRDLWDSEADDSLYFHATYVKPRWASRKSARARINSHIFYR